ncbi:MAG: ABC transporter permease [Cytophagales bacterium]|nr:ABC transporter permease [Cytophagales bacterium]
MNAVISQPSGPLAFWLSLIPFSSPVIMMMRIPFGVPWTELLLSALVLWASGLGMVALVGRVYRMGILHTGSKVSWKQIVSWVK